MWRFISGRLLQAVPVILAVITVTFFLVRIAPGGPFDSEKAVIPEVKAALEAQYRLGLTGSLQLTPIFQLVFDRLTEGGINTHWLPVHSLTYDDSRAIVRPPTSTASSLITRTSSSGRSSNATCGSAVVSERWKRMPDSSASGVSSSRITIGLSDTPCNVCTIIAGTLV